MAGPTLNVMGDKTTHDKSLQAILTGNADWIGDHMPGGKLYGAPKHATITHGTIKSIDSSKALAEPGVKAVITYKEAPTLFSPTILYWGQAVAAIVADDWYTALRAVNLVTVTYDVLPAVVDADEGLKPNSVLSGKRADNNIATSTFVRGNVTDGFKAAEVTLETTQPWTTSHQHAPIEPYEGLAWWVGDNCYAYQSTQNLHGTKGALVNYLKWPQDKVHVYARYTGGGHGARLSQWESGVAALCSKAVGGTPVYFRETKKHNMLFHIRQHEHRSVYKMGAKKDGTLTAVDVQYFTNGTGAGAGTVFTKTWVVPNVNWSGQGVYVNVPDRGAWRCVSDPPQAVNMSTAFDKMAEKLGMNPYDFRKKNLMPVDMPDQDSPFRIWGSKEVNECFETVATQSGYTTKWHAPGTKTLPDGRLHGIGIHCHTDSHGSVSGASMAGLILMQPDGTCLVNCGSGRPHNAPSEMCHFVAEELGLKYDDVMVGAWGETDATLNSGYNGGSAFTGAAGSSFVMAARDARARVFAAAITKTGFSNIAGITVDDLTAKNSVITYTKDPTKTLTFAQAMSGTPPIAGFGNGWAAAGNTTGINKGGLQRPLYGKPVGTAVNAQSACASVAEVAVDPETGEVEILGHWNAVGTGRIVFYQGVMLQMGSGTELQVAQALFYGDIYDPATGAVIGTQYTESQLPTTMDCVPSRYNLYPVEGDDYSAPHGAHGIGEPVVGSYACILTAIYNATGKWVDPDHGACNPDRVLKALGKA
ncbi:MAG: xanthine dehydrogenase family protein molybdopterin-binding subunit [Dehalococcoidia bacterium]|nr:MAG: xanthine dehydrogenase family protein molybdopterin-binding subunit [Dehalococcoidia bacterium]